MNEVSKKTSSFVDVHIFEQITILKIVGPKVVKVNEPAV